MGAAITGHKGSSSSSSSTESADNLISISYAKILLALGEGEWEADPSGQDILLDNTPLLDSDGNANFTGVTWEYRSGSQSQSYIKGVPSVESGTSLSVEITSDNNWTYSVSGAELSAVRLTFTWPALREVKDNGNIVGYRIDYAVDIATDGGSYEEMLNTAVDGKTTSGYERSHRLDLPDGESWQIRVRRLTANQNNSSISDTMQITSITEIVDRKFTHPNTALLFVQLDASQFSSIPTITLSGKARIIRVPSNYDPVNRTYTGTWDGSFVWAWSNNPAWVLYDLYLSPRFGIGDRVDATQVDKWELYNIAQYCDVMVDDGKGGTEPRFACNVAITESQDAWQVFSDLAAIFRGMSFWAAGQVYTYADMPRDTDYIFTNADVIDGTFTYAGTDARTIYTRALVSWDNPDNYYASDVTAVADASLQKRYGDNAIQITALGCTSEGQAQRAGKWALVTNSNGRTVSFTTALEGLQIFPGMVIGVADRLVAGVPIGGRISSVNGKALTLDRIPDAAAGDRLIINLPSGVAEARTIESVSGKVVTVTTAYSETPEAEHVWSVDADDLAVQLFRITGFSRSDTNRVQITGIYVNESKWDYIDNGAKLVTRPVSKLPAGAVSAPASVSISQSVYTEQTLSVTVMTISWPKTDSAVSYDVQWRKDSGEWVNAGRTAGTSIDVEGVYTGSYVAKVRAINAADTASVWVTSDATSITGKTGTPPTVSSLTATPVVFGIQLDWTFPTGAEDTLQTEIYYNTTNSDDGATALGSYSYPTSTHTLTGLAASVTFWFKARLIDRTGNTGAWSDWVQGQSSSDSTEILDYLAGQISETELAQSLLEQIELIPELESQLNELTGAPDWDSDATYSAGDYVKDSGYLYRAKQDVPAGTAVTDTDYWENLGAYSSINDQIQALAAQINEVSNTVDEIDGTVTATASRTNTLVSAYRDIDDGEGALADTLAAFTSKAAIRSEQVTRASANEAFAQQINTLEASIGDDLSATVEQLSQAQADLEGDISAMWKVSMSVTSDGKYYAAGFGLGIENTDQGLQSNFYVLADRFAILNQATGSSTITTPFVVTGGQTILNSAIIGDATITFAKITDSLQSTNYVANTSGWKLSKDGTLEINGSSSNGRVKITNNAVLVYDSAGTLRVRMGMW